MSSPIPVQFVGADAAPIGVLGNVVRGPAGANFQPNATGLLSERSTYNSRPPGFAFLATDTGDLYFREGATAGGWSVAVPFAGSGTDLSITNRTATTLTVASDSGTDAVIPAASGTEAGLITAASQSKLDGIAAGAEVNVNADWNATSGDAQILNKPTLGTAAAQDATAFTAAAHVGSGGTAHANVVAGGAAGFMSGGDKTKLDGVATGATANATDAALRDRATHTGTQAATTITGLATVATSGAYGDLSGRPTLGTAAATAATDYAPAAQGVTGGNSHDHNGGDGAQIAYNSLSGLPTLGTAAAQNVGTSAGNVVQLDGSARLPAVDGSLLTGLPSSGAAISGTPVAGQAAEWASGTAITGVGTTGTGNYVKATAPALSAATVSTSATVTAGSNAQGSGALTSDLNIITTTAANPSGVTLPTATAGRTVVVVNRGTNPVNVYPASGGQIDTAGTNSPYSLAVGARFDVTGSSTTQWQSSSVERTSVAFLAGTGTGVNTALAVNVGSAGAFVVLNGAGGTPSSLTLTNATGLPIAGLTGLGTGIAAALAVNTGSAGAPVLFGGAGGTPSALTLTNATGLPPGGLTMATARLLGRSTAGSGVAEEISIGANLTLTGGVLSASGGGGATNLSIANRGTTTLDVASDTGTDATIPAATTSLTGLLTSADKTKLDGIATGATANATDAALRDRATHTGTQGVATITGLGSLATLSALGNITSAGAIGSTATLPVITTTGGVLTTGTFGTIAGSFCQGNDSRLSDARTPTAHNQAWSTITATPTTLSGYGITDAQPLDADLTSIAALTTTTYGRSQLALADAAADTAQLNVFSSTLKGLAPASGGGTSNFLRADGTWAAPGGGGSTNLTYTASTRVIASDTGTDATLPLVSSGDAGLAPASGGGTTNFLRADGTWAAPAGGGSSSGPSLGLTLAIAYGLVPF